MSNVSSDFDADAGASDQEMAGAASPAPKPKVPRKPEADVAKVAPAAPATDAAAADTVTGSVQPEAASASDGSKVGTVVKRKFVWPGDDQPAMSGAAPTLSPQLSTPATATN